MTALTSLELNGSSLEKLLEHAVPAGLVGLHTDNMEPLSNATLLKLAAMTRLESLSLWRCLETSVPPYLLALPHLTVGPAQCCA